jgi:hypothetical protein
MHLIDVFFSDKGHLFPYVYKPWVLALVERTWNNSRPKLQKSELYLLNIIMALSCVFETTEVPIEERLGKGDVYLEKVLILLSDVTLMVPDLATCRRRTTYSRSLMFTDSLCSTSSRINSSVFSEEGHRDRHKRSPC